MLALLTSDGVLPSFALSLLLIPLAKLLSRHVPRFSETIPPVGGIVFVLSAVVALVWTDTVLPTPLLIGGVGVWCIGLLDDWVELSPRLKTLGLLIVCGVTAWTGSGGSLAWIVIHALWLLWMCNTFNVLDAVDGLSGGVGAITLPLFAFLLSDTHPSLAWGCGVIAVALIAYLFYNFHPARVYMGDSGSLLIGFLLGQSAWSTLHALSGWPGLAAAILPVSIVCFEGFFLIVIRITKVTMPSVSTHDHPTQRWIASGTSTRMAVIGMYTLTAALCAAGLVAHEGSPELAAGMLAGGGLLLALTGFRLEKVDIAGDGVDARPGSVFDKHWLVHRLVHRCMTDLANRASGTLVDLGCGHRPYETLFKGRVDRYVGIDLNPERYEKDDIDVVSDLASLPVADGSADTVVSNQVLEHVPDPGRALAEAARILKPGGVAIVTAPHIWGIHEEPHDYYRFTPYGLRHLAEQAGLEVELISALAGYWVTAGARFCYVLERFGRGPLRPVVGLMNALIQATVFVLDHFHRVEGDAWNHVMVATKPASEPG